MHPRRVVMALAVAALVPVVTIGSGSAAAAEVRDPSRFACPPDLDAGFDDIAGTTHEDAIACAVHYDLTGGTGPRTFSPSASVTRGQMATFIVRLLFGATPPDGIFPPAGFDDTEGSPHENSIDAVVEFGIARGTSPTTFSPNEPVSRAQMASFLDAAASLIGHRPTTVAPDAFDDDDGIVHEDAVNRMAVLGVTGGTGSRLYDPRGVVTRGAMAAFLVRLIDASIEVGLAFPTIVAEALAVLAVESDVVGTVAIAQTDVPGVLCYAVLLDELTGVQALELRSTQGDVVVSLPAPGDGESLNGCISDPAVDGVGDLTDLVVEARRGADDPVAAGALGTRGVDFGASLDDVQVVPGPGDPETLAFAIGFTTSVPDVLCLSVLALSEEPFESAHLHQAAPHANGPVVMDLDVPNLDDVGSTLPLDCALSPVAQDVAADPTDFYVDLHTESFPEGSARGQLELAPAGFDEVGGPAPFVRGR